MKWYHIKGGLKKKKAVTKYTHHQEKNGQYNGEYGSIHNVVEIMFSSG